MRSNQKRETHALQTHKPERLL